MRPNLRLSGFTLIELIIVLAVLAILVAVIVSIFDIPGIFHEARLANARAFNSQVKTSLVVSQVGEWNFDDSANLGKDSSGYGNNGTVAGGPGTYLNEDSCGWGGSGTGFSGCIRLNGTSEYIEVPPNLSTFNFETAMTISFWVKLKSIPAADNVGAGQTQGGFKKWLYINVGGFPCFAVLSSAFPLDFCDNKKLSVGRWYHLAGTYTYDPTVNNKVGRLYVNGALANSSTVSNPAEITTSGIIRMGARIDSLNAFLDGFLDQVSIYKKAIKTAQIQQIYAQGLLRHQFAYQNYINY